MFEVAAEFELHKVMAQTFNLRPSKPKTVFHKINCMTNQPLSVEAGEMFEVRMKASE